MAGREEVQPHIRRGNATLQMQKKGGGFLRRPEVCEPGLSRQNVFVIRNP